MQRVWKKKISIRGTANTCDNKTMHDITLDKEPIMQEKVNAFTRLTQKAYSPLVIRKITKYGFPIYVGIITDDNLDTLDECILEFMEQHLDLWKSDSIQDKRQLAGMMTDHITSAFGKTEGVAVTLYIDKTCISSLFGDFMNHHQCKLEYYTLLLMGTNV
jgi:hypothetical protein